MKKSIRYALMFLFTANIMIFSSCKQNTPANSDDVTTESDTAENDTYKIDLSNFVTWDKNRDIFNPATGELTLKEGYGGGGVWFSYTGNYKYLEIKYKSTSQFKLEVEYSDKTVSKIMCKKNSNIDYIKLEPKKVSAVKIQKNKPDEMSIVLESFTLVQK